MTVKSNRINTSVSFAFANIAENSLEVKQGDLLSFTSDWFVTKATPTSVIIWIANDKFSFPETNETQEQWRVDYNPVIWENTYKMEVSDGDVTGIKVWYFYTMDANQKLDKSTESPSVWQFMVQDIYANCVDVRFVTNVWLAVPQYEDVRLESIAPKNPESTPFDWIYNFTLSNWTIVEWDFSDLCWYLWDVEITGNVTIDQNLTVTWDTTFTWDTTTTGDATFNWEITANNDVAVTGDVTVTGDIWVTWDVAVTWDETVSWTLWVTWESTFAAKITAQDEIAATGKIETQAWVKAGWNLEAWANLSVWGNATVQWTANISWNTTAGGNLSVTGNTTLNQDLTVEGSSHFKDDVDIDEDLNVDWTLHVGSNATIDHVLTVNEQLTLWANATAPQFILQAEKNQANWVAALNASGKLDNSVLPPLAIGQTFVVDSEANMLALTADTGDVCIRTDISKTFIKLNDTNPSTLADWQQIQTSGEVISVNGQTWAVVLDADDIDDTSTTNKFVTAAQIASWTGKQDALGYTPENVANKDTVTLVNDSTHYPASSVVKTLLDWKQDTLGYTAENISNKDTATLVDSATHYPSSHVMVDQLATKQPTLVNQQNIKSINNQSLLGSGNLTITADVDFYYEQTTQGAVTYTLQHTPISDNSIMVFSDSWTAMFPMIDYTITSWVITFVSLWANESAIIRVAAQVSNP